MINVKDIFDLLKENNVNCFCQREECGRLYFSETATAVSPMLHVLLLYLTTLRRGPRNI